MPASVHRAVADYLHDLGRTLSGAAAGVYVVGSVALGDYHSESSDVDLVTVLDEPLDPLALSLLGDIHQRVALSHRQIRLDTSYLTWSQLERPPRARDTVGVRAFDGRVHVAPALLAPSILLWHQLHDQGLAVTGPEITRRRVDLDGSSLRAWCLDQIASPWTPWWDRAAVLLSAGGRESLGAVGPTSGVLGVVRLHHTLTTGSLLSQCQAGEWALTVCEPEWRRLLEECLRVRHEPKRPSLYRNPLQRRHDALSFMDLLMTADEETFGVVSPGRALPEMQ